MTQPDTSILAIHPGALGDVILFGHLLAGMRHSTLPEFFPPQPTGSASPERHGQGNPQSAIRNPQSIALVAGRFKASLLVEAGVVDSFIDFDGLPMHELFSDAPPDQCRLPALLGRCGRIISCFVEADSPPGRRLAEMCGARQIVSLPVRPPLGFPGHLTDLWRQRLGLAERLSPAAWNVPQVWRDAAGEALASLPGRPTGRYAVLHPGAGAEEKCWPIEDFVVLAGKLAGRGLSPLFVLGPVELDRWPVEKIAALRAAGAVLAGPTLPALAGAIAGAGLFVGNDSGPAHLAAAVGTPTVALFGATSPGRFAPMGPRVACVDNDAMEFLSTSQVLQAVEELGVL